MQKLPGVPKKQKSVQGLKRLAPWACRTSKVVLETPRPVVFSLVRRGAGCQSIRIWEEFSEETLSGEVFSEQGFSKGRIESDLGTQKSLPGKSPDTVALCRLRQRPDRVGNNRRSLNELVSWANGRQPTSGRHRSIISLRPDIGFVLLGQPYFGSGTPPGLNQGARKKTGQKPGDNDVDNWPLGKHHHDNLVQRGYLM